MNEKTEKLIPILDTVKALRVRRVNDQDETEGWSRMRFGMPMRSVRNLLTWIETHTEGRFYLVALQIAFEDERDMIMFKLGYLDE